MRWKHDMMNAEATKIERCDQGGQQAGNGHMA